MGEGREKKKEFLCSCVLIGNSHVKQENVADRVVDWAWGTQIALLCPESPDPLLLSMLEPLCPPAGADCKKST